MATGGNADGGRGPPTGQGFPEEPTPLIAQETPITPRAPAIGSDSVPPSTLNTAQRSTGTRAELEPPRQDLVDLIVNSGFPANAAEKGLLRTGNVSADAAVGWILDNPDEAFCTLPSGGGEVQSDSDEEELSDIMQIDLKMVFVVNAALKMGPGKVAAQVAHATLGLYRDMLDAQGDSQALRIPLLDGEQLALADALAAWDTMGETKIVLKAKNEEELLDICKRAEGKVPSYLVRDAGRTQIPTGSKTVLALFGSRASLHDVTAHLKLM